jgi:hypothetical protein
MLAVLDPGHCGVLRSAQAHATGVMGNMMMMMQQVYTRGNQPLSQRGSWPHELCLSSHTLARSGIGRLLTSVLAMSPLF